MKILVNLIPIKKGGGQQVATNFIEQILDNKELSLVFLVTEGTYILQLLNKKKANVYVINNNIFSRLIFQSLKLSQIVKNHKIDIIYTMFGPGLHSKGIKSVTGCAYSNLFFPEINFWNGHSILNKVKLKLIDKYRLSSTLKSDAIIFENEAMLKRANSIFKYPIKQTKLILPSISQYPIVEISENFIKRLDGIAISNFNILMLTGWHKNKNIEMVPFILKEFKDRGIMDVNFIITVSKDHPNSIKLKKVSSELEVESNIIFFDTVHPHEVPLLFKRINAIALFSLLESFSNNIIEAWFFNKPLFVSNEEWAQAICNKAAIYVDRNDYKDIVDKIINYRNDLVLQYKIKINTDLILKKYPDPKKKVELQLNFLKEVLYA